MNEFYSKVRQPGGRKLYIPKIGNRHLHRLCKRGRDAEGFARRVMARLSRGRQFLIANINQTTATENRSHD